MLAILQSWSSERSEHTPLCSPGLVWSGLAWVSPGLHFPAFPSSFPVNSIDKGCGSGIQHRCFSALHAECRLSPPRTLGEASPRIGSILEARSEGSAVSTAIHLPTHPSPSSPWPSVVPTPPRRPTGILSLVMPLLGGTSAGARVKELGGARPRVAGPCCFGEPVGRGTAGGPCHFSTRSGRGGCSVVTPGGVGAGRGI